MILSRHRCCECTGEYGTSRAVVAQESNVLREWAKIVEAYSALTLSFQSDRFPALSGLVARFESNHGLEYIAGLWNHNMAEQLAWQQARSRYRDGWMWTRAAPTFSWASINGEVYWPTQAKGGLEDIKHYTKIVGTHRTLKGPNRFSEISDAYVLLRGRLICAELVYGAMGVWNWMTLEDSTGNNLDLVIHSDRDLLQKNLVRTMGKLQQGRTFWWSESQYGEEPVPVACLKLVGGHETDYYLLLVHSEFVDGAYERVGLVSTHSKIEKSTGVIHEEHLLSLWSKALGHDITIV
jgi:hypothetical protein